VPNQPMKLTVRFAARSLSARRYAPMLTATGVGEFMRTAFYVIIGAVFLTVRAEGQVVASSPGTLVVRDSSVARVVGAALFEHLANNIAEAAFDTTTWPVVLRFPEAEAPEAWRQLRAHLLLATRGRAPRPGDRVERFAIVGEARVNGNALSVQLSVGTRHECTAGKADWTTTEQWYVVHATRMTDGPWSVPSVAWSGESLGPSCDLIRSLSGAGGA